MGSFRQTLRRLCRDDRGVALAEFGMLLPVMMLFIAVSVEASRTFWAYQSTIAGVRDATRYLARAVPTNACTVAVDMTSFAPVLTGIVGSSIDGESLLPPSITLEGVTPVLTCLPGGFRLSPTPVVSVTADIAIEFPFASLFQYFNVGLGQVDTQVADQSRVFGA